MEQLNKKPPKAFSWLFIGSGIGIILISMGVIPIEESSLNAPLWIVGISGFVFLMAGVMILLGEKSPYINLLAAILIAAMGTIGGWVALFGAGSGFSGGAPFLSTDSNLSLARLMFGFGGIICFLIAGYALKQHFTKKRA